jgi:uncharacterized protein
VAIVVSDTSPIRALHHLDLLQLLPSLFEVVHVPPAVENELQQRTRLFNPLAIEGVNGFVVTVPKEVKPIFVSNRGLDLGESEAIALAIELRSLILIDEWLGREAARQLGLEISGTLGVLARAKARGLVPELRALIARLREEIDFHVSDQIVAEVLKAAGE